MDAETHYARIAREVAAQFPYRESVITVTTAADAPYVVIDEAHTWHRSRPVGEAAFHQESLGTWPDPDDGAAGVLARR